MTYQQAFPTGGGIQVAFNNNRQTFNSPNETLNPQLFSSISIYAQQQLLAGFGFGPNLRFLRIAKTNQKVSDIAFKAQTIATVTQICDLYWDLVSAYDDEQVQERSVAFATETLNMSRKQLELQAIPEMDVLKAEGDLATREQDLTVARTNLELQELYMKNAITRSLDDPILQEMPVIPTDKIGVQVENATPPVQEMIADALKNRVELQESSLELQTSELSRKTARNALLPSLSIYGLYTGTGYGGTPSPLSVTGTVAPNSYAGTVADAFNYSSPEYQVGLQLNVPLRNRIAKADQYRTELEYRQSQVYLEELKKRIRIEVRNASYALEQGASRVDAARNARDLAQRTLDIMQKEQKLGAGSNQQTLSAEHDLALAESALVTAETAYEKARIEMRRATGTMLEEYGISIEDAKDRRSGGGSSPVRQKESGFSSPTISRTSSKPSSLLLQPQGIQVDCVRSPQLLLEALGQSDYDVLLIDLNYTRDTTSGQEGLDLLARLQEIDPRLPVIVMTAWGNIDLAVESIKRGARDFIQKPWENERLVSLIRVHAELHQALRRARQLGA